MDADGWPPSGALMRLVTGYQVTQAIYVAAALGIADLLGDSPKSSAELAEATGTHASSLYRLLRALAAFGVFDEVEQDRFTLTPLSACLRADAPDGIRSLVLMYGSENFWRTWGELLHSVRTGQSAFGHLFVTSNVFDYYAQHPELEAVVNAGMAALAASFAAAVVEAYDFSGVGTLVDVGGGRGLLLATILRAHPRLRGVLFDLPYVVRVAAPLLEEAEVADRCEIVGGDVFESIPPGGDAYLLSRVIHDWDDQRAVALLAACRGAMPRGAKLLLVERVLPSRADGSAVNQARLLSDLNMLVRTGGRERTVDEYRALLDATGFQLTRLIPTPTEVSIVEGVRP